MRTSHKYEGVCGQAPAGGNRRSRHIYCSQVCLSHLFNMLVTYLVIFRADMDPNNIGIVRFARAGANFPPQVIIPNLETQVLQLVESLWIIGPHSILTRCLPRPGYFIGRYLQSNCKTILTGCIHGEGRLRGCKR